MPSARATEANKRLALKADALLRSLLSESLVEGFHGRVAIEAVIQDGIIQYVQEHREQKYKAEHPAP